MGRFQLQADQEEHHDDAEFSKVHDAFSLLPDKTETERADEDAGQQVPQHRPHPQALGQRHADQRRGKVDDSLAEYAVGHGCSFRFTSAIQSLRKSYPLIAASEGAWVSCSNS